MEVMFSAVGMEKEAEFVRCEGERLRNALRAEYNDRGVIGVGRTVKYLKPTYRSCQTSQALGLFFGIFNADETENAVRTLVELIKEKDNSFDCGFLGLRYIFRTLSRYGYSDLAYEMITRSDHPSYANMIYRGETSVWERFVPPGERIGSHNHHFMADVSGWYLECVAGIRVNPEKNDSEHILVDPHFLSKLDYAVGEYETPGGRVCVNWTREGDRIKLCVKTFGKAKAVLSERVASLRYIDFLTE